MVLGLFRDAHVLVHRIAPMKVDAELEGQLPFHPMAFL